MTRETLEDKLRKYHLNTSPIDALNNRKRRGKQ